MIRYFKGFEIDRKKWDACIENSVADLIYGYSWYLDLVCPGWSGLVKDDYEAVMPLPNRKKYGVSYIFQPVFAQQLGIFSKLPPDEELLKSFLNEIPAFFRLIEINLNYSNRIKSIDYSLTEKVNYVLNLNRNYDNIKRRYSNNTRRNLQKTLPDTEIKENIHLSELIRMKKKYAFRKRNNEYYEWMHCFVDKLMKMGKGEIIGAESDRKLCAAALFVIFGKRIYYLIPVSTDEGLRNSAMFAILDFIIQKFSGKDYILDFEGSNIPGIARFFEGFGAGKVNYPSIRINRLPTIYKIFKR